MRQALTQKSAPVLVAIAVFMLISPTWHDHPSDSDLEKTFYRHEPDFNKLVGMVKQDAHVVRIAHDFTWLETNAAWPRPESELGFSKERWDEYRRLFNKLGLKEGVYRPEGYAGAEGQVIFMPVSLTGLATGGDEKGYAYVMKKVSPLVDSLDNITIQVQSLVPVYKKLKGNWYLYYLWDD